MMRAGLHKACRLYIEYRSKRRQERMRRAGVTGGVIDETLKHVRPSTLEMLRDADPDIHRAISRIKPECSDLILSGRFIPDDVIIMEGSPSGPYRITMPHAKADQLDVMRHASRYALYVDWNRTPQTFRDAFRAVCVHTGCRIREGRFGGMLDMSRIPLAELAETAKRAAGVLSAWEGASGPGVIIPPGMNHHAIHDILYGAIPDLAPTAVWGKRDDVWGETPYRGGCPECGGEVVRTESCSFVQVRLVGLRRIESETFLRRPGRLYAVWCTVKLVEEQEGLRVELIQSILAYVGIASFLTYRGPDGFVRYAMWFEDHHLGYILGLHAANPKLGGRGGYTAGAAARHSGGLRHCMGHGDGRVRRGPAPRRHRHALGHGGVGHPNHRRRLQAAGLPEGEPFHSHGRMGEQRRQAGLHIQKSGRHGGARGNGLSGQRVQAGRQGGTRKAEGPAVHAPADPAGRKPRGPPVHTAGLGFRQAACEGAAWWGRTTFRRWPPRRPRSRTATWCIFRCSTTRSCPCWEIIPGTVTEVPMKYGRPIVTTSQPPRRFPGLKSMPDDTSEGEPAALYLRSGGGGARPAGLRAGRRAAWRRRGRVPHTDDIRRE